jgi:hypothetical protein
MIIDNFDVVRVSGFPHETDSPLLIVAPASRRRVCFALRLTKPADEPPALQNSPFVKLNCDKIISRLAKALRSWRLQMVCRAVWHPRGAGARALRP